VKILGREPALWLSLVGVGVQLVTAFGLDLSTGQQASINALAAAVVGLLTAAAVHDGVAAAILGLLQAAVALGVGFGLRWSPDQQSVVLAFAGAVIGMFVRTQVAPKAGPRAPALPRIPREPADDGIEAS
jgi:hypothetical protein